ncbi:hypothetical protein V8G54_037738 [Vigna mungo]|uniref:Uncharacterized protein n=1 Tax=Vigna mungo TaxID=3915 RepID=A0AAQ3MJQ3_VIGMU
MTEEKMEGVEKETMSPWEQHAAVINLPRFDYNAPFSLLRNSHSGFLITCTLSSVTFSLSSFSHSFPFPFHFRHILDAQWYSREEVRKALTSAKYKETQRTVAEKVEQICMGLEENRSFASDFNVESAGILGLKCRASLKITHQFFDKLRGSVAGDDIFKRRKLIDDAGEECLDSKETQSATADSGDGIQFIYFLSATSHSVSFIFVHVYVYSDQSQTLLHKF